MALPWSWRSPPKRAAFSQCLLKDEVLGQFSPRLWLVRAPALYESPKPPRLPASREPVQASWSLVPHAQHSVGLSGTCVSTSGPSRRARMRRFQHLSGLNHSLSCWPPARAKLLWAKASGASGLPQGPQSCAGFYTDSESSLAVCVSFIFWCEDGSRCLFFSSDTIRKSWRTLRTQGV